MKKKLYVESMDILKNLGYISTPLSLEDTCEFMGLYFSQDDMGNIYVEYHTPMRIYDALDYAVNAGCVYPCVDQSYFINSNVNANICIECADGYFYCETFKGRLYRRYRRWKGWKK